MLRVSVCGKDILIIVGNDAEKEGIKKMEMIIEQTG